MTSLFYTHYWGTLPHNIPEDTHTLTLRKWPKTREELQPLFAALPQLTRLTVDQSTHPLDHPSWVWTALGLALRKTPHVNYLHLNQCGLEDDDLLKIMEGCSIELCELNVSKNRLKLENEDLVRRLAELTNLQ